MDSLRKEYDLDFFREYTPPLYAPHQIVRYKKGDSEAIIKIVIRDREMCAYDTMPYWYYSGDIFEKAHSDTKQDTELIKTNRIAASIREDMLSQYTEELEGILEKE